MKKFFLLPVFFCAFFFLSATGASAAIDAGELQRILRENPDIILDVLRDNSEVVLDIAQQGSNQRRKNNLEAQWREDIKKNKDVRTHERPVLGKPDARVKIIAFSDFTCHYCEQAYKNVHTILKDYANDAALIFKHLPLDEKGPGGIASSYFIAIALQDDKKAWQFHDIMFENRGKLLAEGEPFIKKTAQDLKVDMKRLEKDLQGKKVKEILSQDLEDSQKLGVEGTPYFLVNNLVVRGAVPLELFKSAVDMSLSNTK